MTRQPHDQFAKQYLTQVAGYQILGKKQPSIHAIADDKLTVVLSATATLTQSSS